MGGIRTEEYLHARLRIPWVQPTADAVDTYREEFRTQVSEAHTELARRLAAEPSIGGVAIANSLPGMDHDRRFVEIEGEIQATGARVVRRQPSLPLNKRHALLQPRRGQVHALVVEARRQVQRGKVDSAIGPLIRRMAADPLVWAGEAAGAGYLVYVWRRYLTGAGRMRAFARTGTIPMPRP